MSLDEDYDEASDVGVAGTVVRNAEAAPVRAAWRRLPNEQREALGLAFWGGYTQNAATSMPAVATTNTDSKVCGDLDRVGEAFYRDAYLQLMKGAKNAAGQTGANVEMVELTAELGVLTTVGAPAQ